MSEAKVTQSSARLKICMGPLAHGGACVGTVTEGDPQYSGKKAFVRETLPGEAVEAELTKDHKNYLEARLVRIIETSPERVTPPCPFFGKCGGCDLQHMSLAAQREAKRSMVESMLLRQAGIAPVEGVSLAGADLPGLACRKRVTLHLDRQGRLGFYKPETNQVVDLDRCCLAAEVLNDTLRRIKPLVVALARQISEVVLDQYEDQVFVELKARETPAADALQSGALEELRTVCANLRLISRGHISFSQRDFRNGGNDTGVYPAGHFSQVNNAGNELLRKLVIGLVDSAEVSDLYGGAGNFGLPLALAGKLVDLVELDQELVDYALKTARERGIPENRLHCYRMRCEDFAVRHAMRQTVILDPPRGGAKELAGKFRTDVSKRIVYISCNLPSLCRDLKTLCGVGYVVKSVQVVDMFPQTHFVENVATLAAS